MAKRVWGIGLLALAGCGMGAHDDQAPQAAPGFVGEPGDFGGGGSTFVGGGQPALPGAVFQADRALKPVSGGTLLITKDNTTAVVADPDRDQVLLVDLASATVTRTLTLDDGSEPGRAVEDAQGHVHLVLRGSGKLLTFDPASGEVLGSRAVCAYPRGVAVSPTDAVLYVACAEGKLLSLSTDASQAAPLRSLQLDRDLRDVVAVADGLWVSRFRSAEILRLDNAGSVLRRTSLLAATSGGQAQSVASVAWRMVASPNGGVMIVHQRAFAGEVTPSPGGYGAVEVSGGLVSAAISTVSETGVTMSTSVALAAPLPVDIAQSPVSGRLLLASAAIQHPQQPSFMGRTLLLRPSALQLSETPSNESANVPFAFNEGEDAQSVPPGQLVAVAFAGDTPVLQYRNPSSLVIGTRGVTLPGESVEDTGSTLFHLETASGLACASCHPEGQEDGRVWHFSGFGERRTQSLRGGLRGTEPFHWDGAEQDFTALTQDVMQGRMAGPALTDEQSNALARYIDVFPSMAAPAGTASAVVSRGQQLFNDANVGCATCHSGARFSNNQTVDVGSADGLLQVPGLVGIWARAPYLHDGCAENLLARFTHCDNGKHGNVQGLSSEDLGALTAYLESL